MKVLTIFRGAPGSSKSTLAGLLAANEGNDFAGPFEADDYMVNSKGQYEFDPSKLGECHRLCRQGVELAMRNGVGAIIQSNTNILRKDMQPYLDLAHKYGYKVREIIVKADFGNTHGVPVEKVEQMRARFQY